jgi:hypothetical protein
VKENKQDMLEALVAFDKALSDLYTAYATDWRNSGTRCTFDDYLDKELERLRGYEDALRKAWVAREQ